MAFITPDQQLLLHGIDIFLEKVKYLAEWVDTAGQRLNGGTKSVYVTLGYVVFLPPRCIGDRL